jgi:hypothetical protein
MTHNHDDFPVPEPGDEVPKSDSEVTGSQPFGTDVFSEVPPKTELVANTDACVPGQGNDDSPQWDVPGATFIDPPSLD